MSNSRELFGVAANGIASRKVRTLLILLGPVVGVAAMVGAVGLTESAKGDLKQKLATLGTNLITVEAAGSFGQQNPTLPKDVVKRVHAVPTVERASAVSEIDGVVALPSQGSEEFFQAIPVPVLAADDTLPTVLEVPLQSGRWLRQSDRATKSRAVVIKGGFEMRPLDEEPNEKNIARFMIVDDSTLKLVLAAGEVTDDIVRMRCPPAPEK